MSVLDKAMETTVGAVDRRFLLTAFLPTALFLALVTITVWPPSGQGGALAQWQRQGGELRLVEAIAFVAVALLGAALLAGVTGSLIRAYEGYWPGRLGAAVGAVGRRHHRVVLTRLGTHADPGAYARIEAGYPFPSDPGQVMPTTLGNVLRNAELYPRYRYGLDAVLVWPRLFLLAPDRALAGVAAARADLELHLIVSFLSFLYALIAAAGGLLLGRPWWAFPLLFTVPMVVGWLSYRVAITSARTYGNQVKAVFDLHRLDLLDRCAAELTGSEEERWHRLQEFWYRAVPADVVTMPPAPMPAGEVRGERSVMRLSGWFALAVALITLAGSLWLASRQV
ncbi:hypothetical protein ABZW49_13210 [Nonomuraea wenchangensis]